jgi:UDP:flavonoid glycosyltransferase YjiC (YdhE family)
MRVTILTLGSTGDLMPFVWLGRCMRETDDVVVISHPDYRGAVEASGVRFGPAGPPLDLERSEQVREQLTRLRRRPAAFMDLVLDEVTLRCPGEHLDDVCSALEGRELAVIHHLYFAAQEAAIACGVPWVGVVLMPNMLRSQYHAPAADVPLQGGPWLNGLYWRLGDALMWRANRRLRETLRGLSGRERGVNVLGGLAPRLNLLAASPLLSFLPPDLPPTVRVTGVWLPRPGEGGALAADLDDWLGAGSAPVVVSLGSAGYRNGPQTLDALAAALEHLDRRALVYSGFDGRLRAAASERIRFFDSAPFGALLPRAACIVHHGGAGTSAFACRAGIPSVVVPHFADHFYWADALRKRGVAPAPIRREALNERHLTSALREVLESTAMQARAAELAVELAREDGLGNACEKLRSL